MRRQGFDGGRGFALPARWQRRVCKLRSLAATDAHAEHPHRPVRARALAGIRAAAEAAIERGQRVGLLVPTDDAPAFAGLRAQLVPLGAADDLAAIGRLIFAGLRALDHGGAELILARGVWGGGLGLAIWDRLVRAAEGHVVDVG